MAQLVARFHGMEEARGSNPLSSTLDRHLFYTGAGLLLSVVRVAEGRPSAGI